MGTYGLKGGNMEAGLPMAAGVRASVQPGARVVWGRLVRAVNTGEGVHKVQERHEQTWSHLKSAGIAGALGHIWRSRERWDRS